MRGPTAVSIFSNKYSVLPGSVGVLLANEATAQVRVYLFITLGPELALNPGDRDALRRQFQGPFNDALHAPS